MAFRINHFGKRLGEEIPKIKNPSDAESLYQECLRKKLNQINSSHDYIVERYANRLENGFDTLSQLIDYRITSSVPLEIENLIKKLEKTLGENFEVKFCENEDDSLCGAIKIKRID